MSSGPRRLGHRGAAGLVGIIAIVACMAHRAPPTDHPFEPVRSTLEAQGHRAEFASFTVEEKTRATESAFARRFRELAQEPAELREFAFHGIYRRDHPAAAGALRIDQLFLARAFEARPFDEWDLAAMMELARAHRVALHGLADVRWFLRADVGLPPIDVEATADPRRWRFHVGTSGVPDPGVWQELELDAAGVPVAITG